MCFRSVSAALLAVAAAWSAPVSRQPYLQSVSGTHAAILWATRSEAGEGGAKLTGPGGAAVSAASKVQRFEPAVTNLDVPLFQHRVDFDGLRPGSEYVYEVTQDGADLTPQGGIRFRTDSPRPVRFVVFGDSGDGGGPQRELARRMNAEQGDFAIHTGDLAYQDGTFAQFDELFFGVYAGLLSRMPLYPAVGNHEYHTREAFPYRSMFVFPTDGVSEADRGRYYSFERGPIHFAMVDSNWPLFFSVHGPGPMIRWLEEDLRRTKQRWRVVVVHHTPFPNGHHRADDNCRHAARWLTPIMERHGVDLVLTAHEHNYQRTGFEREGAFHATGPGTVYVTTGGAGSVPHPVVAAPSGAVTSTARHYVVVEADAASLRGRAVGLDGEAIDEFTLAAQPPAVEVDVRDSASFAGTLAPGALFSVFASDTGAATSRAEGFPLPTQLGGATLTLGSRTVPLLFASPGQINAQVPFDAEGEGPLRITTAAGTRTVPVRIRRAAPAIFLVGELAALVHPDGRLVNDEAPAGRGEWLSLFITGLGPTRPPLRAGEVSPASPVAEAVLPVRVDVADQAAEVAFAGMAPGMAGVGQVNFRIADTVEAGRRPLRVCVGAACSNVVLVRVP